MSNLLVFNVKTVPNIELGKKIYNLSNLDDDDVSKVMFFKQRQDNKTDLLPLSLLKIVAISVVIKTTDKINIISLGKNDRDEKNMVQQFFDEVERHQPKLISWNGKVFDIPILYLRAINYFIQAKYFWQKDATNILNYNGILDKDDESHIDLIDILPTSQLTSRVSLNHYASLLGAPCTQESNVINNWSAYLAGDDNKIKNDCDIDCIRTYIVFLRLQHFWGYLSDQQLVESNNQLKDSLGKLSTAHLLKFLEGWNFNPE